jgi:hypothetical protein
MLVIVVKVMCVCVCVWQGIVKLAVTKNVGCAVISMKRVHRRNNSRRVPEATANLKNWRDSGPHPIKVVTEKSSVQYFGTKNKIRFGMSVSRF